MRTRILSGLVYGIVMLGAAVAGGWVWLGLVSLAAVQATREGFAMAKARGRRPVTGGVVLAGLIPMVGTDISSTTFDHPLPGDLHAPWLLAATAILVALTLMRRPRESREFDDWTASIAIPTVFGSLLAFLAALRFNVIPVTGPLSVNGSVFVDRGDVGLAFLMSVLFLVWMNDSAAYFGGRAFGKRPFFASISPKKTLEGALSGLVGSTLLGWALPYVAAALGGAMLEPLAAAAPWKTALLGFLVGIAGPAGDLSVSMLKRSSGVKDSGSLIPGHGGVLDRVDSLMFVAPVAYWLRWWLPW